MTSINNKYSYQISHPDETDTDQQITFGELNTTSNQIANKIVNIVKENNLRTNRDGDWIISICMKPSIDLIIAMLATWKAGAAYLPIDVAYPDNRISFMLQEARPLIVLYDDDFGHPEVFEKTTNYALKFKELKILSDKLSSLNIADDETMSKGERLMAMILYTSGTTGFARGVRITHSAAQNRLEWYWKDFPFNESETQFIFKSSVTFIDHFGEIWNPLFAGKIVVIVPEKSTKNPEKLVAVLDKYKIERIIAVPQLLRGVLTFLSMQEDKKKLSYLKLWVNSGEVLTLATAKDFFEYFDDGEHALATFYGSTEVMADVITFKVESMEKLEGFESFPIGRPSHRTTVYIMDDNEMPVREGETGEIYIAGGFLACSYVNSEEDHDAFMTNHLNIFPAYNRLFRTGDFGQIRDGLVFFEGRRDSQIKMFGHRVELKELQNAVNGLHYLEVSSVQVRDSGKENQKVLAFVELKRAFGFMKATDIESDLRKMLPKYMVPQVVINNQFPFLPNGKVDVQELLRMYDEEDAIKRTSFRVKMNLDDVPEDKLELAKNVFQIIGETLNEPLSIKMNFYDIGGTSLNTISCVNEFYKMNYDISITDFLKAKNIGDIIEQIEVQKIGEALTPLEIKHELDLETCPLNHRMKKECIAMIAKAFLENGELEQYIYGLKRKHFVDFLELNWDSFVDHELCFMALDQQDRLIGVSLNFEVGDDPKIASHSPLESVLEYIGFVEQDVM